MISEIFSSHRGFISSTVVQRREKPNREQVLTVAEVFNLSSFYLELFIIEPSHEKSPWPSIFFVQKWAFCMKAKKEFFPKKLRRNKNVSKIVFQFGDMLICVGDLKVRITWGCDFGRPFLKNRLVGLRGVFSHLTAQLRRFGGTEKKGLKWLRGMGRSPSKKTRISVINVGANALPRCTILQFWL